MSLKQQDSHQFQATHGWAAGHGYVGWRREMMFLFMILKIEMLLFLKNLYGFTNSFQNQYNERMYYKKYDNAR